MTCYTRALRTSTCWHGLARVVGTSSPHGDATDAPAFEAVLHSNRAACYGKMGDHRLELQDAQSAVREDGSFAKGYLRLVNALLSRGRPADAVEAAERGVHVAQTTASQVGVCARGGRCITHGRTRDISPCAPSQAKHLATMQTALARAVEAADKAATPSAQPAPSKQQGDRPALATNPSHTNAAAGPADVKLQLRNLAALMAGGLKEA